MFCGMRFTHYCRRQAMKPVARLLISAAAIAMLAAGLHGCADDPSGPAAGMSRVQILITDAPSDYIAEATIWVSHVYLQGGEEDDAPRVDLFNDPENPKEFDLMELRDGITAELTAPVDVDPANYHQLRIVVDSARVTLIDGVTFSDQSITRKLMVPSGSQTGIKVDLAEPIDAEEGETTLLVVDFDVDQNFVLQGNPETPAGILGILFTPRIVERERGAE
jgi:hypothetical protein